MNVYIARVLAAGGTAPTQADIDRARIGYWRKYGATLLGMMRHHQVDPAHFLAETHELGSTGSLASLLRHEKGLRQLLRRLPGRKILLTNAPRRYSRAVLRLLKVQRHFSGHIAIEDMHVHGQL